MYFFPCILDDVCYASICASLSGLNANGFSYGYGSGIFGSLSTRRHRHRKIASCPFSLLSYNNYNNAHEQQCSLCAAMDTHLSSRRRTWTLSALGGVLGFR
jgi:hypothetical protein